MCGHCNVRFSIRSFFAFKMARVADCTPCNMVFDDVITGYHVYKDVWDPILYEELVCEREPQNAHDQNAIKLLKGGVIVGHVLRHFSRLFWYLLLAGTRITATVIGARQHLRNNGLEVPCRYKLKGPKSSMMKAGVDNKRCLLS